MICVPPSTLIRLITNEEAASVGFIHKRVLNHSFQLSAKPRTTTTRSEHAIPFEDHHSDLSPVVLVTVIMVSGILLGDSCRSRRDAHFGLEMVVLHLLASSTSLYLL